MTSAFALIGVLVVLAWPVRLVLLRARWLEFAPRAAIVLWQAIGLAVGTAILGACFVLARPPNRSVGPRRDVSDFTRSTVIGHAAGGFTPNQIFGLTAGLIVATTFGGALLIHTVGLMRHRAHQRILVDLVTDERTDLPGARVIEHPDATAYSLLGLHPRIVVSSGAIDVLSQQELAAVIAHERAHVRGRHDLVLLPFRSLSMAFPRSNILAEVDARVRGLVEMAADDRAKRVCDPHALAGALCQLANVRPAEVVCAESGPSEVARRVDRVLAPSRGAKAFVLCSLLSAAGVLALPGVVLFAIFGGR